MAKPNRPHGRARRSQPSQSRQNRADSAKAKGTVSEAKPRNSVGGWITIQGFSRFGFSPCPSVGTGIPCVSSMHERRAHGQQNDQEQQNTAVDGHHAPLGVAGGRGEDDAQDADPEGPQQKRAFLPGPEGREPVQRGHRPRRVLEDVGHVKAMRDEQIAQRRGGGEHGRGGQEERGPAPFDAVRPAEQVQAERGDDGGEGDPDDDCSKEWHGVISMQYSDDPAADETDLAA